jgi:hypothetical protein
MIKKSEFHHRGTEDTEFGMGSLYLAFCSSQHPSTAERSLADSITIFPPNLRALRVFVVNIPSANSVSLW